MDIKQLIETNFVANTAGFSGPMSGVITTASAVGSTLSSLGGHFLSMAGVADTSLTGILDKVIDLGSKFEMLRIQMAGTFAAMGSSKDINAGLGLADGIIKQINIDAAKMPGEAEEYFQVFKTGFPQVRAATTESVKDITKFTNLFTAFGKVQGESAMSISLGMEKLLAGERGMASARIGIWRTLLPYIHQTGKYANLTQKEFNEMTNVDRLNALKAGLSKVSPMIEKMNDTWETQIGTLKTVTSMSIRLGSSRS